MVAPQKSVRSAKDKRESTRFYEKEIGGKTYKEALMQEKSITKLKMVKNQEIEPKWSKIDKKHMIKAIDKEFNEEYKHAGLYAVKKENQPFGR